MGLTLLLKNIFQINHKAKLSPKPYTRHTHKKPPQWFRKVENKRMGKALTGKCKQTEKQRV